MKSIALTMIVRDCATDLDNCLKSCHDLFDQIIIIDTGSIDNTKNIASKYTNEVIDFKWIDDFSTARNYALQFVKTDFWCWIDSDDILSPDQRNVFSSLKASLENVDVVLSSYLYSPGVLVPRERIIRTSLGLQWKGVCHESVAIPPNLRILRSNFGPTHCRQHSNGDRNLKILEKVTEKDPRTLIYLANEYADNNIIDKAIIIYKEYLKNPDISHINALLSLANCYLKIEDQESCFNICIEGIKASHGCFAEFYILISEIYFSKQQYQEALHWATLASKTELPNSDITILTDCYSTGTKPWLIMSLCLNYLGKIKEAYECALKSKNAKNIEIFRDVLFPGRIANKPVRISVGSGGKNTNSYFNSDIYDGENIQEIFSCTDIPYPDSSVEALHSEHQLEHLSKIDGEKAIKEWARVLKPYGKLELEVPDLESCCGGYLEDINNRWWYSMTLFGRQSYGNPPYPAGEHHLSGYNEHSLTELLEKNGFRINSLIKSNKYSTPSIEVKATCIKPIRIQFVSPYDNAYPVNRLISKLSDYLGKSCISIHDIIVKPKLFDVFVFLMPDLNSIRMCQDVGGYCVQYVSEDWLTPDLIESCNNCHLVVCCSSKLRDKVETLVTTQVIHIADAFEN